MADDIDMSAYSNVQNYQLYEQIRKSWKKIKRKSRKCMTRLTAEERLHIAGDIFI